MRVQQGLSREELAERAGIHPTYVEKIEAGKQVPSLDVLLRISSAVGVPLSAVVAVLDEYAVAEHDAVLTELVALARTLKQPQLVLARDFLRLLKQHAGLHARDS